MKKILVTNKYPNGPRQIIENVVPEGYGLIMLDEVSHADLVAKAPLADYILASGRLRIDDEVLDNAPKVKMIQRTGVGLDSIDFDSLRRHNVALYVNQGINADSVAEHTILLMLSCLRCLSEILGNTKSGVWIKQAQGIKTHELRSQTIGIIGMGNIGQKVARLVKAFGSRIICHTYPQLTTIQQQELGIEQVSLDHLFRDADIISLHCPLTPETKEIIRAENLSKMRDGVMIVNTARGTLVNEADMLEALNNGKVSFAGLDVFQTEPPTDYSLIKHPHVISTPHIAGVTYDSFSTMMHDAMRNIQLYDKGMLDQIECSKYKY